VGDEAYVRYVAERAARGDGIRLEELHAGDLYLACACTAGDPQAIAALDRSLLSRVVVVLVRSGTPRAIAEEAVQRLRERLFVAARASARRSPPLAAAARSRDGSAWRRCAQ
jgi:RNA polymerase sigma-70 factor (ECF subfamily)